MRLKQKIYTKEWRITMKKNNKLFAAAFAIVLE